MDQEESKPQEVLPKVETKIACPCCGQMTLSKPPNPGNILADHWVACMLAGVPFNRVYPLYGGKVQITVSSLSNEDADDYMAAVTLLSALELAEDRAKYEVDLLNLRQYLNILVFIKKIEIRQKDKVQVYQPADTAAHVIAGINKLRMDLSGDNRDACFQELLKFQKLLGSKDITSTIPLASLIRLVQIHNSINNIMTEAGFDSSFWEGIELA